MVTYIQLNSVKITSYSRILFFSQDFGQCKIITYTSQLLRKPQLHGFNCTLSPGKITTVASQCIPQTSPSTKLQVCALLVYGNRNRLIHLLAIHILDNSNGMLRMSNRIKVTLLF